MQKYLIHWGVLGQKWGKRNYQYEDGSLTPEGRIHYGVGPARIAKNINKAVKQVSKKASPYAYKPGATAHRLMQNGSLPKDQFVVDQDTKDKITGLNNKLLAGEIELLGQFDSDVENAYSDDSFLKKIEQDAEKYYKDGDFSGGSPSKRSWEWCLDSAIVDSLMDESTRAEYFPNINSAALKIDKAATDYRETLGAIADGYLKEYANKPVKSLPEYTNSDILSSYISEVNFGHGLPILGGRAVLDMALEETFFEDSFPNKYPFNKYA